MLKLLVLHVTGRLWKFKNTRCERQRKSKATKEERKNTEMSKQGKNEGNKLERNNIKREYEQDEKGGSK